MWKAYNANPIAYWLVGGFILIVILDLLLLH